MKEAVEIAKKTIDECIEKRIGAAIILFDAVGNYHVSFRGSKDQIEMGIRILEQHVKKHFIQKQEFKEVDSSKAN